MGEALQRVADGDGADPQGAHHLPHRGQARAGWLIMRQGTEMLNNAREAVIRIHEKSG
jgi:hypothetical protein